MIGRGTRLLSTETRQPVTGTSWTDGVMNGNSGHTTPDAWSGKRGRIRDYEHTHAKMRPPTRTIGRPPTHTLEHVRSIVTLAALSQRFPVNGYDRGRMTHRRRRRTSAALARASPALHYRIKHGCRVNSFPPKTHHVSGHAYLKTAGLIDFFLYFLIFPIRFIHTRTHVR